MSDTIEWRWVDVDGKQAVLAFDELSRLLASESLPPFALVWRSGWPSWLAAANVPELREAVGKERAGPPTVLRAQPGVGAPPAPPLERYRGVAQKTLLGAGRLKPQPSMPPPPPRPRRSLEPPKQARVDLPPVPPPVPLPQAPIPVRDVQPTLAGEEPPRSSQTLRPAGALPPPPRSYPQQKLPAFAEVPPGAELEGEVVPLPLSDDEDDRDEVDDESDDADEVTPDPLRTAPRSVPPPMPRSNPPPHKDAHNGEPASGSPVTSSDRPKSRVSRKTVTTITAASLLLPGTALLIAAFLFPSKKKPDEAQDGTAAVPTHVVTLPPQTATAPLGCTVTEKARKLEASAFGSVPLLTARAPDGKALVGFAATKEQAVGLSVDPSTLEVTRAFEQTVTDSTTLGVVPVVRGGPLAFVVDRADKAFSFSRTIDAEKRFSIGVTADGFARRTGTDLTMIWPGKSDNPTITTPRAAHSAGKGYAVAFRHGGQEGKVLLGWLDDAGAKGSELGAVGSDAALVGTPSIAVSDGKVLVAFAGKKTAEDTYVAEIGTAEAGTLPTSATPFAVPAGGPGGEVISPAAEALSQGRFLLQWTEGSAGNRAVRVQVLSPTLVPVGDPITLSNQDQNAGQGALFVDGERALALFLVKNESAHELWGAALKCP